MEKWQLQQRQNLPLEIKEQKTLRVIRDFINAMNNQVAISYSGGKDSEVLRHLVHRVNKDVEVVSVPIEFPENIKMMQLNNATILNPKFNAKEIIEKYGYPVVSKEVSKNISRFRNTKTIEMKEKYLRGSKSRKIGVIPNKYHFLINAPFKISDECCNICKKKPLNKYKKESGKAYFIGTMACESQMRERHYLKSGCSVFDEGKEKCNPLGFWTNKDVDDYIKKYDIQISKAYDWYDRTGCWWCLFGIQHEKEPNRIQKLKTTHPKLWEYCIKELKYDKVLEFMGVAWDINDTQKTLQEMGQNSHSARGESSLSDYKADKDFK